MRRRNFNNDFLSPRYLRHLQGFSIKSLEILSDFHGKAGKWKIPEEGRGESTANVQKSLDFLFIDDFPVFSRWLCYLCSYKNVAIVHFPFIPSSIWFLSVGINYYKCHRHYYSDRYLSLALWNCSWWSYFVIELVINDYKIEVKKNNLLLL